MSFRSFLPAALLLMLLGTPGAVAAAPSSTTAGPAATAAAPTVHAGVTLGDCAISGISENVGSFTLEHRSAKGRLKASHAVTVTSDDWSVPCPGPRVMGGDRLRFITGAGPFHTLVVPSLRLTTDRGRDRITGTAPRVAQVALSLLSCDVAFVGCTSRPEVSVSVSSTTHRFSYQSGEDITGTWRVVLRWVKSGDSVYLSQRVAQLVVRPGSSVVGRTGRRAGDVAAVSVRRGDRIGLAAPHTRSDASFAAHVKLHGAPMKVRKGDVVSSSIAGDAVITIPATSIALTVDGVGGRCFKDGAVSVVTHDAIGGFQGWSTASTDEFGRWSVTTPLSAGWSVDAYCGNVHGDAIKLHLLAL